MINKNLKKEAEKHNIDLYKQISLSIFNFIGKNVHKEISHFITSNNLLKENVNFECYYKELVLKAEIPKTEKEIIAEINSTKNYAKSSIVRGPSLNRKK